MEFHGIPMILGDSPSEELSNLGRHHPTVELPGLGAPEDFMGIELSKNRIQFI